MAWCQPQPASVNTLVTTSLSQPQRPSIRPLAARTLVQLAKAGRGHCARPTVRYRRAPPPKLTAATLAEFGRAGSVPSFHYPNVKPSEVTRKAPARHTRRPSVTHALDVARPRLVPIGRTAMSDPLPLPGLPADASARLILVIGPTGNPPVGNLTKPTGTCGRHDSASPHLGKSQLGQGQHVSVLELHPATGVAATSRQAHAVQSLQSSDG